MRANASLATMTAFAASRSLNRHCSTAVALAVNLSPSSIEARPKSSASCVATLTRWATSSAAEPRTRDLDLLARPRSLDHQLRDITVALLRCLFLNRIKCTLMGSNRPPISPAWPAGVLREGPHRSRKRKPDSGLVGSSYDESLFSENPPRTVTPTRSFLAACL